MSTLSVLDEILAERRRQDEKWGEQNHPDVDPVLLKRRDGTRMCEEYEIPSETRAKWLCQEHARRGDISWPHIAVEEMSEAVAAFTTKNVAEGRRELVQLVAVVIQWIQAIDRREAPRPSEPSAPLDPSELARREKAIAVLVERTISIHGFGRFSWHNEHLERESGTVREFENTLRRLTLEQLEGLATSARAARGDS